MSYDALCIWFFWDSFLPSNVTKSLSTMNGGDTRRNNPPNKIVDHASISNFQLSNLPVRAVEGDSASHSLRCDFSSPTGTFRDFGIILLWFPLKQRNDVTPWKIRCGFSLWGAHTSAHHGGQISLDMFLFWISAIHKIDLLLRGLFNGTNAPSSTSQVFSPFFPSSRAT